MTISNTGKDYVVLGFGNIGKNIVRDLAENNRSGSRISVYDPLLTSAPSEYSGVTFFKSDPFSKETAEAVFDHNNVVISALPPNLMQKTYDFTIKYGGNLIDIASIHADITGLLENRGDFLIIPEFGVAPGISNFLVGHFISDLDELEDIGIYVGGIPTKPTFPIDYKITWSTTALINMYLNTVEIYENGQFKAVEPLTGLEDFEIEGFDHPLEAFYTDGLSTLKYTVKSAKNMFEKTVRYKGHAEKINLLKNLGYFDSKEVHLPTGSIRPRDLTEALFNDKLRLKDVGDTLLMKIVVTGVKKQKRVRKVATLVHSVSGNSPFTAMSHTTGFPPSIMAQMIGRGEVRGLKGYLPPQIIGKDRRIFDVFMVELARRGINITIDENSQG